MLVVNVLIVDARVAGSFTWSFDNFSKWRRSIKHGNRIMVGNAHRVESPNDKTRDRICKIHEATIVRFLSTNDSRV